MIRYQSTRGSIVKKSAAQAVIRGIAEDKGLYVPETMPEAFLTPAFLESLKDKTYPETAAAILPAFLTDYTAEELQACIDGAYNTDKFSKEEIVPLQKAGGAWFLELYHGRTAAFKDMALSILPYLLTTAMKKEGETKKVVILTATSGDTGKAALEGFADVPGTEIIVFYPETGVSQVQKQQMITQEGENTHVFGIRGNFDDAQTGVKKIFTDAAIAKQLEDLGCKFSSANSINIGRLVPQVVYYVWAYTQLLKAGEIKAGEAINVVVPTGNFGNILAAWYAKALGLPVKKFICASNENNVLTDFINTGVYDISERAFHVTSSPSMDILISSNLERLLYHLSGNDGDEIRALMTALETEKKYEVSSKIREGLADFVGGCADQVQTAEAIGSLWKSEGYLMDTHTAVGYSVYKAYKEETGDDTPAVIASTASPYKFADSVSAAIDLPKAADGFAALEELHAATSVTVPKGLQALDKKAVRHPGVVEIDAMTEAVFGSLR
ncbi:MAG: threonine synthase [Firmicutes bacterium]|nr:threonine synthase [Bacillota bacterium]